MELAHCRTALGALSLCCLVACQTPPTSSVYPQALGSSGPVNNLISGYGVVQAIDLVPQASPTVTPGMVGGAVVGGLLGNQIGSGSGNTAATIAGAAGGAMVGRQIEKSRSQGQQDYRVTVRMDNGTLQSFTQSVQPAVRIGDRVQIMNGMIQSY